MSTLSLFRVKFRAVKTAAAGQAGSPYTYTKDPRIVQISAASGHPKDLLAVLTSDITLQPGETLEILSASPVDVAGTESSVIA